MRTKKEEEQKIRQAVWEMYKYLKNNSQLMHGHNKINYECFREVQIRYFIREGACNNHDELVSIVDFLADMEIINGKCKAHFSQKKIDNMYKKLKKALAFTDHS